MRLPHLTLALALLAAPGTNALADSPAPHLEHRGVATQLVVDGTPYLVLGGELANTASSDLAYMDTVWPRMAQLHLNTVLVGASWALVEPKEGVFDFAGTDALIAGARRQHLRIAFIWFGSWKNSLSNFAPDWVKRDQARFPRVQLPSGRSLEILSALGENARRADAKAFAAFQRHLRAVDSREHTVIMIQLENEVGILGEARDHSAAADAAFAAGVPPALLSSLVARHADLRPELKARWEAAGARPSGTWTEVFGAGEATDELFMAWQYASYLSAVAAAGKAEYALPIFTNTWIVQPEDKLPGDYPSGGPEPHVLDVWKAGAPAIDLNCPDIYLPEFAAWCDRFARPDNPLFVPESRGDAGGVANAFYAIGQRSAIGYSPFGIDNLGRLETLRPDPNRREPTDPDSLPLPKAYALLGTLAPLILEHQAAGTIAAASVTLEHPRATLALNGYELTVELRRNRRNPKEGADLGFGLFFATGPDTFLAAGADIEVSFRPTGTTAEIAGVARAEAGTWADGRWTANRTLNGDDIVIRYDLAQAAADGQSGSGLRFLGANPTLQRVELYRYR